MSESAYIKIDHDFEKGTLLFEEFFDQENKTLTLEVKDKKDCTIHHLIEYAVWYANEYLWKVKFTYRCVPMEVIPGDSEGNVFMQWILRKW